MQRVLCGIRSMKYLLDTNIISEAMKQQPDYRVLKRLELDSIFSCTSATVWHELWHGVNLLKESPRKKSIATYLDLLVEENFTILPFCQLAAEWLAEERVRLKEEGITPAKYDSEIAAVAYVNQLTVVTRNERDFSCFVNVRVDNWFK